MSAATVPRRLVLVGSVVVDVKLRVPVLPSRGGDVIASALSITAGGGFFVLSAATSAGLPALYAGRHGTGPFGDVVRQALDEHAIGLAYPADDHDDTGPCVVLVEPDGERTMITSNGVEAELTEQMLATLEIRPDDAVYVSGYDLTYPVTGPAIAAWLTTLDGAPLVIFDPGPLVEDIPADVRGIVLARSDVLTLNLREALLMTGLDEPAPAAAATRKSLADDAVLVLRDGARGATVECGAEASISVEVEPVNAPDTTGAGDIHTGSMIASCAARQPWPQAVAFANARVAAMLAERALRS